MNVNEKQSKQGEYEGVQSAGGERSKYENNIQLLDASIKRTSKTISNNYELFQLFQNDIFYGAEHKFWGNNGKKIVFFISLLPPNLPQ